MCVHVCVCTGVCACVLCVLWVTCVCVHMCKRGSEGRTAKMLPQEREDGMESGWCQDLKCIMYMYGDLKCIMQAAPQDRVPDCC